MQESPREHKKSHRRKRRSPRLPKAVEVRLAGRGQSGGGIVESTETVDISKHGACVATRNIFPIGSPIAIRRPGAAPMRARVVSSKAAAEGVLNIGVEFIGDEGNWDLEFPKDWDDYFRDPRQEALSAANAEARHKMRIEDGALEGVLRKAEALRATAESMLAEYAAHVHGSPRPTTPLFSPHVTKLPPPNCLLNG